MSVAIKPDMVDTELFGFNGCFQPLAFVLDLNPGAFGDFDGDMIAHPIWRKPPVQWLRFFGQPDPNFTTRLGVGDHCFLPSILPMNIHLFANHAFGSRFTVGDDCFFGKTFCKSKG